MNNWRNIVPWMAVCLAVILLTAFIACRHMTMSAKRPVVAPPIVAVPEVDPTPAPVVANPVAVGLMAEPQVNGLEPIRAAVRRHAPKRRAKKSWWPFGANEIVDIPDGNEIVDIPDENEIVDIPDEPEVVPVAADPLTVPSLSAPPPETPRAVQTIRVRATPAPKTAPGGGDVKPAEPGYSRLGVMVGTFPGLAAVTLQTVRVPVSVCGVRTDAGLDVEANLDQAGLTATMGQKAFVGLGAHVTYPRQSPASLGAHVGVGMRF